MHSAVHDVLDDALNHPGLQPVVQSLDLDLGDQRSASANEDATGSTPAADLPVPPKKDGAKVEVEAADSREGEDAGIVPSAAEGGAADKQLLSPAESEAMNGMNKLMDAVKMIIMLQPMMDPLRQKLPLFIIHLSPEEAKKATSILKYIHVLDVY